MSPGIVRLEVPDEAAGSRLDRFLTGQVPGTTRSALRRMILDGRVVVDGAVASKAGRILEAGSIVVLDLPEAPPARPGAENIPVEIAYEDDDLVVVVKPAGLVVHPGHGNPDGTLVNALLGRGTSLSGVGGPDRPGIVHRLDRDTSGLLVVAKNDAAHHAMARAFAERRIEKTYHALVWGRPDPDSGEIERSIGRSRRDRTRMSVRAVRGRSARTAYTTVETMPGFALLRLRLHTGRTHQIRVHLQSIHHPVVGDTRYGGRQWRGVQDRDKRNALRGFHRLALHASRLEFAHPASGRPVRVRAELPEDLEDLLRRLRG
jgi:23S rRNA pseudouridine1911/1915/1917 synthase